MSPSSPHSRSSGMQSIRRSATLPAVVTVANPVECPSFVRCQGQGIHGCVSRSGVLRIVLRTPVGGVSQSVPHARPTFVHRHSSTSFIVAWYFGFQVAIESHVLVDRQGLTAGMTRDQLKLSVSQATSAGSAR